MFLPDVFLTKPRSSFGNDNLMRSKVDKWRHPWSISNLGAIDCLKHTIPSGMGSLPVWCLDSNVHTLTTVRTETDWHRLWWWAPSEVQHCLSRFKAISAAKAQSAQWSVESWKLHHGKQQPNKSCVSLTALTMGSSKLNMIVAASKTGKKCLIPLYWALHSGRALNWKGTWSDSKLPFLHGACAPQLQMVVTLRHRGEKLPVETWWVWGSTQNPELCHFAKINRFSWQLQGTEAIWVAWTGPAAQPVYMMESLGPLDPHFQPSLLNSYSRQLVWQKLGALRT